MRRAEVIKLVKEVLGMSCDWDDKHYAALEEAIAVLEEQPSDEYDLFNLRREINGHKRKCKDMIDSMLSIRDKDEYSLKRRKEYIYKILRTAEKLGKLKFIEECTRINSDTIELEK